MGVIIKYQKKGELTKSKENEFLIVDEKKNAYKVDQAVVVIWTLCDGEKTKDQLVDELANQTNVEKDKIQAAVFDVLSKLEEIGLVEKVQ